MKTYQIDRRYEDGTLMGFEFVAAKNASEALGKYLEGWDMKDVTIETRVVNGRKLLRASCPAETSEYWEVQAVR